MHISNPWNTQYNNRMNSLAKDTTDANLLYLQLCYSVYCSQTPNGLRLQPSQPHPTKKLLPTKAVLLSRQQQFPPAAQNTRLAALNTAANWKTNDAVCNMLICYRWSTTQSHSWPSPPCTLRLSPSQWTFTGQMLPSVVRRRPQLTGRITPEVQLTNRWRLQTLPKASPLWPARSTMN